MTPLAGGLMIGAAAAGLLFLLGRIAGISGILWNAIAGTDDRGWRWCFLAGLLAGPLLYHFLSGDPNPSPPTLGWPYAVAGGLLVGFGTRLGSGCTSGHGVCGIGRLAKRSIVATLIFHDLWYRHGVPAAPCLGDRMKALAALACGLLFGVGLALSGMTDTAKVLGFLDLFGNWDPDLVFVMGGAVAITLVSFPLILRGRPLLAAELLATHP